MSDNLSKEMRSKIMSSIRGKWTNPEIKLHNALKGNKIKHTMHPKIKGSPDIILKQRKIAIYLHGCFWHGCKKCYRKPRTNADFWRLKIKNNRKRDKECIKALESSGWAVIVLWEHEIEGNKLREITSFLRKS